MKISSSTTVSVSSESKDSGTSRVGATNKKEAIDEDEEEEVVINSSFNDD